MNASYVKWPRFEADGSAVIEPAATVPAWIIAESPAQTDVADFLTMIIEQKCPLVVMMDE